MRPRSVGRERKKEDHYDPGLDVGLSTQKDTQAAAREATQTALSGAGIHSADLALVFATADHGAEYNTLLRTVRTTAQAAPYCRV